MKKVLLISALLVLGAVYLDGWNENDRSYANLLHQAAREGDVRNALIWLGDVPRARVNDVYPMYINASQYYGFSVLHSACYANSANVYAMVQLLLQYGANVNAVVSDNRKHVNVTPLHFAIDNRNMEVIRLLIASGAYYKNSMTAARAIQSKSLDIVKYFYNLGTPFGEVASTIVECGDVGIADFLRTNGVDLVPAALSSKMYDKSRVIMEYVFSTSEARPLTNWMENNGWSLLHYLARDGKADWIGKLVLTAKSDLDRPACIYVNGKKNTEGWTPLHLAADNKRFDSVRTLVERGAYIDARDEFGWTPLYLSLFRGDYQTAKYLIGKKAGLNYKAIGPVRAGRKIGSSGWNALHLASIAGNLDCVKSLVEAGAKAKEVNAEGYTALNNAAANGHADVVRYLLTQRVDVDHQDSVMKWSALHVAAAGGFIEIARLLISAGADVNLEDGTAWTPMHHACRQGQTDVVKLLVDKGAKLDKTIEDENEEAALHLAAKFGHEAVVRILLSKDIDLNIKDKNDHTPLHLAVIASNEGIVRALVAKKAKLNVKDEKGNTPLHYAVMANLEGIAELLARSGAKQDIENRNSETVIQLARNKYGILNILGKYKKD